MGIFFIIPSGSMINYWFLIWRYIISAPFGMMVYIISMEIIVGGCRTSKFSIIYLKKVLGDAGIEIFDHLHGVCDYFLMLRLILI